MDPCGEKEGERETRRDMAHRAPSKIESEHERDR